MTRIVGADVSLNHGAFVLLEDDQIKDFAYFTDAVGSAERSKKHGHRLPASKHPDRQVRAMERLAWIENFVDKKILMAWKPEYMGLEDYALRAEQGAHQLGEVGGIVRILAWFRGIKLRLHDPITAKMFVTWDGTAQKDLVERKVEERWGIDFGDFNTPAPKPTAKNPKPHQNRRTSEDLADAYGIARVVLAEIGLRAGTLALKEMHAKEIQVFNRVTKTYPINLLDRDWIHNKAGTPTPHGEPVCEVCKSRDCCNAKKKGKAA